MSVVGTTTFAEDGEMKYFTLQNEQYIRRLSLSGSTIPRQLRIGLLCSIDATASFTGGLWIGLGSSTNGYVSWKQGTGSWLRAGGAGLGSAATLIGQAIANYSPNTYVSHASGSYISCKGYYQAAFSASIKVDSGGTLTQVMLPTTENPPRKGIVAIDVTRVGSSILYAFGGILDYSSSYSTGSANKNYTVNSLYSNILNRIWCYLDDRVQSTTFDTSELSRSNEVANPLDTVSVFWTGSAPLRIYHIAIGQCWT